MDLSEYRNREKEKERTKDLMSLIPLPGKSVLDIGTRDGWFSKKLTAYYHEVTALDLEKPDIEDPRIRCVKGDVTRLDFGDSIFDLVFCTEVLEHIPADKLETACVELVRVAKKFIIVGVPYRQDIRRGRTLCRFCGKKNPPWGHVNSFTREKLEKLFSECKILQISFVGQNDLHTNMLSEIFMDLAGNPYGTYHQEEPCVHCGSKLRAPKQSNFIQKICTRLSVIIRKLQQPFCKPHPRWIHILFEKNTNIKDVESKP
jgi:SAM-dependent methyltransferase